MMRLDLDANSKILGDRYYLHYLIAQSNHSKIFFATDLAIDFRKYAIKQMYPRYFPVEIRSEIESAFLQEVQILKKFARKHPQICQFYNYFVDSGNQYIVQEWIEGITLEEKLRQQIKLSESETKSILLSILSILEYVHSLGIVHNDIKPDNIILRSQDRLPVLIDFGVAREVNYNYGQNIVGTPGYMSLEQAMGKTTFSNDLYSLGLTAIFLLTGKSPQSIDFNSEQDNFWQREKTAFDPKLVKTIDRAISLQGDRRFTSAVEMRNYLESSAKKAMPSVSTSRAKSKKLGDFIATAIISISGIWFYLSYLTPQLSDKPPVEITNSFRTESSIPLPTEDDVREIALNTTNNALQDVIFVPGTTEQSISEALGEPLWRKPGFWENSVAWSYENIVAEGFDIGYIFDRQTETLRQAEIAVPPETDISTVQAAMNSFLATESLSIDIKQGLEAVYQRQTKTYNFTTGNLQGIIQRNDKDRIYLAVWQADFH